MRLLKVKLPAVFLVMAMALLAAALAVAPAAAQNAGNGVYDTDGDRLIEITYIEQLHAMHFDLDGNGQVNSGASDSQRDYYAYHFPVSEGERICLRACRGYELARSLDFYEGSHYRSGEIDSFFISGNGWEPINHFDATLDGNGHTIEGLYSSPPRLVSRHARYGFFGETGSSSVLRNLGLIDVVITGRVYGTGALAGENKGSIIGSYASGTVKGSRNVGGLVGVNHANGAIRRSHSGGAVNAVWQVGGLVGTNNGTISESYSEATVSASGHDGGDSNVGGLVGRNGGTISYSHATGSVTGLAGGNVGGLVGRGSAEHSHATGDVRGGHKVGGLIGSSGSASYSYATGDVSSTGDHVGGLIGSYGSAHYSYATGDVSSTGSRVGGLIGFFEVVQEIVGSYATGRVSGASEVGGLAGYTHRGGVIDSSYATGAVEGPQKVGGLVGRSLGTEIKNSYAIGNVRGNTNAGGLVGSANINPIYNWASATTFQGTYWNSGINSGRGVGDHESFPGAEGKTTAELQSPTGYTGIYEAWDDGSEGDVWDFGTGSQYPALKVDFNGDGIATAGEFGLQHDDDRPAPASCVVGSIAAGVAVNGEWLHHCGSVNQSFGSYGLYYTFSLAEESAVTITLESEDADTYLYLLAGHGTQGDIQYKNDDYSGGGTNSRIHETLPAGAYTIEAATYWPGESGNFTLELATGAGRTPAESCRESVTLDLASRSGTWANDCPSVSQTGSYARYYTFSLTEESEVTITLESPVDPYLYLLEGGGTGGAILYKNDDYSGGGRNSRIQETLGAGSYTIEATTWSAGETGSFTLSATAASTAPGIAVSITPAEQTVASGSAATFTVAVSNTGGTALSGVSVSSDTVAACNNSFTEMASGATESYDCATGALTSGLTNTVTVTATASGGRVLSASDAADVTVSTGAGDDCTEGLTADGTVSGTWAAGCDSQVAGRGHARYYTFTLAQQSQVAITLERTSGDADTYLYLRSGSARSGDHLHENDDDGGAARSRIEETLAAGTYTIEATTYAAGQTGSFTLAVSGLGPAPGPADQCGETLAADGEVPGAWAAGCDSQVEGRGHARYYTFTLAQQSTVTISLESGDADTYLYLRDGDSRSGDGRYSNDDHEGAGLGRTTDSQIVAAGLPAGTYIIEATTYEAGLTGSFTLTVSGL